MPPSEPHISLTQEVFTCDGTKTDGFFCTRRLVDYSSSSEDDEGGSNSIPISANVTDPSTALKKDANENQRAESAQTDVSKGLTQPVNEDMMYEGVFIDFDHHNGDTSDDIIEYEDGIVPAQAQKRKVYIKCQIRMETFFEECF